MDQTVIYFNPELDTVHVAEHFGDKFRILSNRTNKETVQSIKVLAIGFPYGDLPSRFTQYLWECIPANGRLETIVLVFAESTRKHIMEEALIEVNDCLQSEGRGEEQKMPVVKVMTRQAFEDHF
jgi:hypothetical protein